MSSKDTTTRRGVLAAIGTGATISIAGCLSGGSDEELNFLGFGGNTQEAIMNVFEEWDSDITVDETSAAGTAEMISLIEQNPGTFDVITFNDTGMARAQEEGVIEPVDVAEIPNYQENMDDEAQTLEYNMDGDDTMGLLLEHGATGYAYNTELVDEELTSWDAILDPAYEGDVSLIDRTIDRLSNSAIAEGININDAPGDNDMIDQIFDRAEEEHQNVFSYWSDGATSIQYLREENGLIVEAWGGRVLALQDDGYDHIEYVVPEEGAMGWADNFAIVEGTENREEAHELLDYAYERENLLEMSDHMNYTIQVEDPPDEMMELPDYAHVSDLDFRNWDDLLPLEDEWTERLETIKAN